MLREVEQRCQELDQRCEEAEQRDEPITDAQSSTAALVEVAKMQHSLRAAAKKLKQAVMGDI